MRPLHIFVFLLLFQAGMGSYAFDFKYKNIKEFDVLSMFDSVENFEAYYEKYIQNCLDNTGGGTGGVPCFMGYEIWDRELNIYYKKLYAQLDENGKKLLKKSQLAWLTERDLSIEFNSMLLDNQYTEPGTMYVLMRAGDADALITPIIKSRALVLKKWFELIHRE